jgi:hypothetical protein
MEERFGNILHDCRNLSIMKETLPILGLRQLVHDYHFSYMLLENELHKTCTNDDEAVLNYFVNTNNPHIVAWRNKGLELIASFFTAPVMPWKDRLEILLFCVVKCDCYRIGCYYRTRPAGQHCYCTWPLPVSVD